MKIKFKNLFVANSIFWTVFALFYAMVFYGAVFFIGGYFPMVGFLILFPLFSALAGAIVPWIYLRSNKPKEARLFAQLPWVVVFIGFMLFHEFFLGGLNLWLFRQ